MNIEEKYKALKNEGFIDFVTFHPSYSYEEFVEGYKPKKDGSGFELRDGIFKRMCCKALDRLATNLLSEEWKPQQEEIGTKWDDLNKLQKNKALSDENVKKVLAKSDGKFLLIIDEINRANISKVLGELIYALEYRGSPVKLLYSQNNLIVPPNLYIIGTMNTADKSIALLDVALRRRFGFHEFMPKIGDEFYSIVEKASKQDEEITKEDILNGLLDIGKLLEIMNDRIVFLADREKQIGHSYFLSVFKDGEDNYKNNPEMWRNNLVRIWFKEIIPLLQEYFYNDYEKIRMVVGGTFVKKKHIPEFIHDSDDFYPNEIKRYEIVDEIGVKELLTAIKYIFTPT